jgi:hypothetical protein
MRLFKDRSQRRTGVQSPVVAQGRRESDDSWLVFVSPRTVLENPLDPAFRPLRFAVTVHDDGHDVRMCSWWIDTRLPYEVRRAAVETCQSMLASRLAGGKS